ncbi:MAG: hypothetical protein ACI9TY_001591 [Alphaproteobacteria bacterium]|jgi:hypothetical protein
MLMSTLRFIKRMTFYVIFFCTLTVAMLLALMSYKPFTIDTDRDIVNHFLNIQGNQLRLRKLSLWFDGSLHMKGEDGEVYAADDAQILNINKLEIEFSTSALLLGRLAPKHIDLEGLSLDVNLDRDAFYIAGFPVRLDPTNSENTQAGLIDYLNQKGRLATYYTAIKTVRAHNINLNIKDDVNVKSWYIKDGDVAFTRSFRSGETIHINGNLARSTLLAVTPVQMTFHHPKYAESATLDIKLENASSKFLDDYIPFENPIKTKGEIALTLDLLPGNVIKSTNVIMEMQKGTIHASSAYNFPFEFKTGYMDISYSKESNGLVTINTLSVLDNEDWPIDVSGTISNILEPKKLDFNLSLLGKGHTTINHVASYLPDRKIRSVTNWIRNNVSDSQVSNLHLIYNGRPSELPFCDKTCGFDGSFDFTNFSLTALKKAPTIRDLTGSFEMKKDYIKITAKTGKWVRQNLEKVEAVIAGYFTEGVETGITVNGTASGSIQGVIDIVEQAVSAKNPGSIKFAGTHKSKGSLYIPFKDLTYPKVRYNYKSDVKNVATTTVVKGFDARVPLGTLSVTQDHIKLEAPGTLNGLDVTYDWRENMQNSLNETLLSINVEVPADMVVDLLSPTSLEISETVSVALSVKASKNGHYDYTFLSDLNKNKVVQSGLNWVKEKNIPLTVIGKGVYKNKSDPLVLNLSAIGENVNIQGNVLLGEVFEADFEKFDIGQNKLKAAIKGDVLNLVGQQLDLSSIDILSENKKAGKALGNLNITGNIENVIFKNGSIKNVTASLERQDGQWAYIDVTAGEGQSQTIFTLKYPSEDHMSLRFDGYGAGETFKTMGLIKTLRNGHASITADIYTVDGKKQGKGLLKIEKVHIVEAPVMAQLLSLISLTELLSQKKGIYFDNATVPLLFVGDEMIIDHASLSGPSIGLRLKGKINTKTDLLNIEGQLIPAEGLNSLVSKIPLLGTLLTGSQAGLLVADFSVKGTKSKPKVFANPISFVMPGLIKDFFGTLFGAEDVTKPTVINNEKK